jgi:hypothetical protein
MSRMPGIFTMPGGPSGEGDLMEIRLTCHIRRAVRFGALLGCGIIAAAWMIEPAAGQSGLGAGRVLTKKRRKAPGFSHGDIRRDWLAGLLKDIY